MRSKIVNVVRVLLIYVLISWVSPCIDIQLYMKLISVRMQKTVVNVKVTYHNNVFVGETITVQATLFKCINKVHLLGWTIAYTN